MTRAGNVTHSNVDFAQNNSAGIPSSSEGRAQYLGPQGFRYH